MTSKILSFSEFLLAELSNRTHWTYSMAAKSEIERKRALAGKAENDYTHKGLSNKELKHIDKRNRGLNYAGHKLTGIPKEGGKSFGYGKEKDLTHWSHKKSYKEWVGEETLDASVEKHRAKLEAEKHDTLDQHIHRALRAPYEHNGNVYRGNTLDGIHEYLRYDTKHPHITKRALEDHLHSHKDIHHLDGHSRLGWTKKGQTKRSKARFFTKKEAYT